MDLYYTPTDVGYEVSQIEKISFILDSMHYHLTFVFLKDVTGSIYASKMDDE